MKIKETFSWTFSCIKVSSATLNTGFLEVLFFSQDTGIQALHGKWSSTLLDLELSAGTLAGLFWYLKLVCSCIASSTVPGIANPWSWYFLKGSDWVKAQCLLWQPGWGCGRHIADEVENCSLLRFHFCDSYEDRVSLFLLKIFSVLTVLWTSAKTPIAFTNFEPLSVVVTVTLSLMLNFLCTSSNVSPKTSYVWLPMILQQADVPRQMLKVYWFIQWIVTPRKLLLFDDHTSVLIHTWFCLDKVLVCLSLINTHPQHSSQCSPWHQSLQGKISLNKSLDSGFSKVWSGCNPWMKKLRINLSNWSWITVGIPCLKYCATLPCVRGTGCSSSFWGVLFFLACSRSFSM